MEGKPCAVCPEGKTWSGGACADCGATSIAWATVAVLVLVGSRAAYFFVNEAVARQQGGFAPVLQSFSMFESRALHAFRTCLLILLIS